MPKQREKSDNRFYIEGHDVFLYKRVGTSFWWCGFHSHGEIIRTSTKEKDELKAIQFAKNWYYKKRGEIDNGIFIVKRNTFEKVSELALIEYENRISKGIGSRKTLDGYKSIIKSRVLPYFKDIDIKKITNQTFQQYKKTIYDEYPEVSNGTLHQYKNGIRIVLNYAYNNNLITSLPEFKDEFKNKKDVKPRPPFSSVEYNKLHRAIKSHADDLRKRNKNVQADNAMELYDFVIIGVNTGMRVGELMNMKFSDVSVVEEMINGDKHKVLHIVNIKGKRGENSCKSYIGAHKAFERICQRRNIIDFKKSNEKVFLIKHHVLFNTILKETNLKMSKTTPPRKRDFVSLRSSYINFRLLAGVLIQDIATNVRNSEEVIRNHYAKDLGGILLKDLNKTRTSKIIWEE